MPTMTALEAKLAKLNNAPPEPPPETAAETPKPATTKGRGKQAAAPAPAETSREDKAHVGAWLHKDFKRSLLLARGQTGEDVQTFFARVLNAEFKARGVPVVNK
jgi:hypothetical protein